MRMSKADIERQREAIDDLRASLLPGSEVRTILRHVSRSGMARWVSVVIDGEDRTWQVARALGEHWGTVHDGIRVDGCGMDMGFALVYRLSALLYPDGFACIGEHCPSNDHSNGDRDYTPGHAIHSSGGYALKQRWL